MNKTQTIIRKIAYITLGILSKILGHKPLPIFVLCYHSISDNGWYHSVSIKNFKRQLNYLKENFDIISLSELDKFLSGKKKINRPSVVITFDDGYKNVLSVRDLFKNILGKPTVLVISNTKLANYKQLESKLDFLSDKDLKSLLSDGWEIGSHTMTHPDLVSLDELTLKAEIKNSKRIIENKLSSKVRYIAYPKGRYNENVINIAKDSGYVLGLTMNDDYIRVNTDKLEIPRIGVNNTHSFTEFKYLYYPLISKLRKLLK